MKTKLKFAWLWVSGAVMLIVMALWKAAAERIQKMRPKSPGEELKAKVAAVKAQRDSEKETMKAEIDNIEAHIKAALARDSVDVANEIIAEAKK